MHSRTRWTIATLCTIALACAANPRAGDPRAAATVEAPAGEATLAQIYFWRARPGMSTEYERYITEVAEPIDAEAHRAGAFISVTTYAASDTTLPWTHMRVFHLRDSAQLRGLGAALSAAGARLEPDSTRRRQQSDYSATLRDRVGGTVTRIVR